MHVNLGSLLKSRRNRICVGAGLGFLTFTNKSRSVTASETPLGSILLGSVKVGLILSRRGLVSSLLLSSQILSNGATHLVSGLIFESRVLVRRVGARTGLGSLLLDMWLVVGDSSHTLARSILSNQVSSGIRTGSGNVQFSFLVVSSAGSESELGSRLESRLFVLLKGTRTGLHLILLGATEVNSRASTELHGWNTVGFFSRVLARGWLIRLFIECDIFDLASHRELEVTSLLLICAVTSWTGSELAAVASDGSLLADGFAGTFDQLK